MSNAMKMLTFIVSLLAYLIYATATNPIIVTLSKILPENIALYIWNTVSILGFLLILYTQAFVRHLYVSRHLKNFNVLKEFPISAYRIYDRIVIYMLPALLVIVPIIREKQFSMYNLTAILFLLLFVGVVEVLIYIHSKSMNIYMSKSGFIIRGVDIRFELPVPSNYPNASGYYPFERIEGFLALPDRILLYHGYDLGVITIPCSGEDWKQIKGLLVVNKVPERRFM